MSISITKLIVFAVEGHSFQFLLRIKKVKKQMNKPVDKQLWDVRHFFSIWFQRGKKVALILLAWLKWIELKLSPQQIKCKWVALVVVTHGLETTTATVEKILSCHPSVNQFKRIWLRFRSFRCQICLTFDEQRILRSNQWTERKTASNYHTMNSSKKMSITKRCKCGRSISSSERDTMLCVKVCTSLTHLSHIFPKQNDSSMMTFDYL